MDPNGLRIELNGDAQLPSGDLAYPVGCRLLVPNDPARHMPTRSIEVIVAPCQQGTPSAVLNQQIDIHQRRQTTDEKKYRFRQAILPILDGTFNAAHRGFQVINRFSHDGLVSVNTRQDGGIYSISRGSSRRLDSFGVLMNAGARSPSAFMAVATLSGLWVILL